MGAGPGNQAGPDALLLVQSFDNTWDGDDGSDLLLDPPAARGWLTEADLWNADRAPEPAELDLARRVRESIRAMLVANGAGRRWGGLGRQADAVCRFPSLVIYSPSTADKASVRLISSCVALFLRITEFR